MYLSELHLEIIYQILNYLSYNDLKVFIVSNIIENTKIIDKLLITKQMDAINTAFCFWRNQNHRFAK